MTETELTDQTDQPKEPLGCLACPLTTAAVEELEIEGLVTFDESLHLCSRCKPSVEKVTLGIARLLCGESAGTFDAIHDRLREVEVHLGIPTEDSACTEVKEAEDDDSDPLRLEREIANTEALVLRLFAWRDNLVTNAAVDAFAARYSETNAVLNRQWGEINEVRKLLGLDSAKKKPVDGNLAALGAIAGAMFGAGLMVSQKPLETLRFILDWAQEMLHNLGMDAPEDAAL
jgi:hypothetical protein